MRLAFKILPLCLAANLAGPLSAELATSVTKTPLHITGPNHFITIHKPKGSGITTGQDIDISSAVCVQTDPQTCFAASDETTFVQGFSMASNQVTVGGWLFLKSLDQSELHKEFDIEALATSGTKLIAVGSHGWKRNSCEKKKRQRAVFIGDVQAGKIGTLDALDTVEISLKKILKDIPALSAAYNKPLQQGGVNIEGAAVLGDDLYFGFRAPSVGNRVLMLSVNLAAFIEKDFSSAKLIPVTVGGGPGQGIRAMEPHGDQLLILTGDSGVQAAKVDADKDPAERENCFMDSPNRGHSFKLHLWQLGQSQLDYVTEVTVPNSRIKAEGLLNVTPKNAPDHQLDVVVWFDGQHDGHPVKYEIKLAQ